MSTTKAQVNLLDEIIVDNFAGGGGASTGMELATGKSVNTSEIICNQMNANVPVIQSNPNPIRNPNTNAEDAGEAPASHSPAEKRHQYGEYKNVLLSDTDAV